MEEEAPFGFFLFLLFLGISVLFGVWNDPELELRSLRHDLRESGDEDGVLLLFGELIGESCTFGNWGR